MRVRDLKRRITILERNGGDDALIAQLLSAALALAAESRARDDMSVRDLILRLRSLSSRSSKATRAGQADIEIVQAIVDQLRSVFGDDDKFAAAMDRVRAQRSATKGVLVQVFYRLFERERGVPKTSTRDELLRLISDERHILVRNDKMGKMLGRGVPAE